LLTTLSIIILA